ncbi:MAG: right-handed parallel beta-helix repeat-containing protein [Planctomycetota bacterium]|nr:right-handed parallel beta-helix repeat-containing protein [Planctomycetota bacterium]MDA1113316.1 right-handed parallel beta-helix repeat-containing protein [Planctomycetota bacterium]
MLISSLTLVLAALATLAASQQELPVLELTHDNTEITQSCRISIPVGRVISDSDGNGVIQIRTDGIEVIFEKNSILRGERLGVDADSFEGIGIHIEGAKNVVLRNIFVRGYRCGVLATQADGLVVDGADFRRNFHQRLKSTPEREDASDWLWPHENDAQQWRKNYGAGLCIERSDSVVVQNVVVREQQNGIILDRVTNAELRSNDCSFLSGWGLAMWRSCDNLVQQNRFDFCVRGYSHKAYNRGQDSAGILMFEQCSRNRILSNSATHCGDGIFAFSGKEALGENPAPQEDFDYTRLGNNDNQFIGNILNDAAAHGLELTFGFGNLIRDNTFHGNAICGVWAGFSQDTTILQNDFRNNGSDGYGLERGAINIDHSRNNLIQANQMLDNAAGLYLWSEETPFSETPWGQANDLTATGNVVLGNVFQGDGKAVHLRGSVGVQHADNSFQSAGTGEEGERESVVLEDDAAWTAVISPKQKVEKIEVLPAPETMFRGRDHIVIAEWGPWDQKSPLWQRVGNTGSEHRFRMLPKEAEVVLRFVDGGRTVSIRPMANTDSAVGKFYRVFGGRNSMDFYILSARVNGRSFSMEGVVVSVDWEVRNFESPVDPREDVEAWRAAASEEGALVWKTKNPNLNFQSGGPKQVQQGAATGACEAVDHFGTIMTSKLVMNKGAWKIRTYSDDGIRLWADDVLLIDNWTHHGPTWNEAVLTLEGRKAVNLRVEHFELDGHSVLDLKIVRSR